MAAILGPEGAPVAINIATDGPGDLFWGDYRWHHRTFGPVTRIMEEYVATHVQLIRAIEKDCLFLWSINVM